MISIMEEKINRYLAPYHWAIQGFYLKRYERPARLILNQFNKMDIVLDAGSGDGRLTAMIAGRVKRITGIDKQKLPLEFARIIFDELKIKNAEFKIGDILNLARFKDKSFDKITCFDVIEHVPREKAEEAIKHFSRMLKENGKLYLTTPNMDELSGRIFGHKIEDKHYYEYNVRELVDLFKPHFKNIKVNGYYIQLIPKAGRYPDVFPFKTIFNFLINAGLNKPEWCYGILIQGEKKQ